MKSKYEAVLKKLDTDSMSYKFDRMALDELTGALEEAQTRANMIKNDFSLGHAETGKINVRKWRDPVIRKQAEATLRKYKPQLNPQKQQASRLCAPFPDCYTVTVAVTPSMRHRDDQAPLARESRAGKPRRRRCRLQLGRRARVCTPCCLRICGSSTSSTWRV